MLFMISHLTTMSILPHVTVFLHWHLTTYRLQDFKVYFAGIHLMHIENSLPDPLAFYGYLRISEYATLLWVDVCLTEGRLSIMLHQSKIDPFRHGHSIQLYLTTCPLHAFQLYSYLPLKNHPPLQCLVQKDSHHYLTIKLMQSFGTYYNKLD